MSGVGDATAPVGEAGRTVSSAAESGRFERHRLRTPREHGRAVVDPPWSEAPGLVEQSRQRLRAGGDYDVQGRRLADLAAAARSEFLSAARGYTAAYRDPPPPPATGPVLIAGHQPQLFHPGVWFKNFAMGRLARERQGTAVNLVIDSDTLKEAALRVPRGTVVEPAMEWVPFDEPAAEIPFEERSLRDPALFASFGARAAEAMRGLVPHPLVNEFWPLAVARSRATGNLGECLSQSRHQLEGSWGLQTLELPQSRVCALEAFHWFVAHLVAQLPRFRDVYNAAVAEYRRANRIRSANHPVPYLAADGGGLEAPFWIWTADEPRRRRLFARQQGRELVLTDRSGLEISLPLSPDSDAARATNVLDDLPRRGIRLRTRALATTLFARLFLGDLFLHGIGGGRYDQLTDLLIRRFFGLEPPAFLVLSATLHLPIDRPRVTADDARLVEKTLRDLQFHPEQYLRLDSLPAEQAAAARALIETKRRWIGAEPTRENARQRCRAIRQVNESLQSWLAVERETWLARRAELAVGLRAEAVLGWREFGFCLYPEEVLRNFLLAFPFEKP